MRKTALPLMLLFLGVVATACVPAESADRPDPSSTSKTPLEGPFEVATLAGGCFWCVESAFDDVDGVASAVSGYTGGEIADPTYSQVSAGRTRHLEAVEVRFDPDVIDYHEILRIFWRQIDPTDDGGQFADRGNQYRTAIFVHGDEQRAIAERSRDEIAAGGRFAEPIVTRILPAGKFYEAEEYHQDYHAKHPAEYKRYRYGSGRTPFLERIWGEERAGAQPAAQPASRKSGNSFAKPSEAELLQRLSPIQFRVTQQDGTEPRFANEYWDHEAEGIYVDVVSGEPLFSSTDKFESGTGWPSFTRPLVPDNLVEQEDHSLIYTAVEVRSKLADSHLGHVFPDGPPPTGLRYCINSAALRFVPRDRLDEEGFSRFETLFD